MHQANQFELNSTDVEKGPRIRKDQGMVVTLVHMHRDPQYLQLPERSYAWVPARRMVKAAHANHPLGHRLNLKIAIMIEANLLHFPPCSRRLQSAIDL